jgi:hypothetical protein
MVVKEQESGVAGDFFTPTPTEMIWLEMERDKDRHTSFKSGASSRKQSRDYFRR